MDWIQVMSKGPSSVARTSREAVGVLPSRIWWRGARALWRGLKKGEKATLLLGMLLPVMEKLAKLGSLGMAMKAVGHSVRGALSQQVRIELCLAILLAFGLASLIQLLAEKVRMRLRRLILQTTERCQASLFAAASDDFQGLQRKAARKRKKRERTFLKSGCVGIQSLVDFFSAALIVMILLCVVVWFNLTVGVIMMVSGAMALFVLRSRTRGRKEMPEEGDETREQSRWEGVERSADAGDDPESAADDSEVPISLDKLDELERKSNREGKIAISANLGIAALMAASFYLVSEQGAIDEKKAVWIFVFILGLRLAMIQGKAAISKWGRALSEKRGLLMVARGALAFAESGGGPQAPSVPSAGSPTARVAGKDTP